MKNLVFIVEDNLVQQKMLKTHFEEVLGNYSIRTFLNPVDLIENLKEKPFAVVLDHFFVPGEKTGLHYLRELRKDHPSIPVIYLTVLDDNAVRSEVMALGAEGYIVKDSASLVRLRTMLDQIHKKISVNKTYWRDLFIDSFSNFFNIAKTQKNIS